MSRGVRDLRDLICVSRLSYRESDEEVITSDDDLPNDNFDALSISSGTSDALRTAPFNYRGNNQSITSPDSGFHTNGSTPPDTADSLNYSGATVTLTSYDRVGSASKEVRSGIVSQSNELKPKKRKKKKKALSTVPTKHELPKQPALPPVRSSPVPSDVSGGSWTDTGHKTQPEHNVKSSKEDKSIDSNFDSILCYMDATVVSSWLTRSNTSLNHLCDFATKDDNFVLFSHFWLSDFPDIQKHEIFDLECEILKEELGFAFASGRDAHKVSQGDIHRLISALFREYPSKLLSSKGSQLFLDYLDILTSERTDRYKKLLSDVKCSTRNRQYAQWLLATRSFAIVNVWTAVTNFYRNLIGKFSTKGCLPLPPNQFKSVYEARMHQAIRGGFVDVVHYLIISSPINPRRLDSHGKTLIFVAVMHNQPDVLQYLLSRVKPEIDVNLPADTGNTALHAAANNGNDKIIKVLLDCPAIHVNVRNLQCDGATPLHLAVMHGQKSVVDLLLQHGADASLKMADQTALDIAKDFGQTDIVEILKHSRTNR